MLENPMPQPSTASFIPVAIYIRKENTGETVHKKRTKARNPSSPDKDA